MVEETDAAEVRTQGGSAVSFTRDASSGVLNVTQELTGLEPSRWYRVTWWWRTSADTHNPETRGRVQNVTTSEEVGADGETWHGTGTPFLVTAAASTTWTEYTALFRTADTHLKTDTFRVLLV